MKRRRMIYEGKAKILYEGPEPGTLVQYFKDDTTAFDATKRATIEGKGVLNNRISEYLMMQLAAIGVPTHFVRRLNMREQLFHFQAHRVIGADDVLRREILLDLVDHVLVPGLEKIGLHNRLRIGFGVGPRDAHLLGRPQAQKLVAPGDDAKA